MAKLRTGHERVATLTPEESYKAFDEEVQRRLGMDAESFIAKWKAGALDPEDPAVGWLSGFLPSFRQPDESD